MTSKKLAAEGLRGKTGTASGLLQWLRANDYSSATHPPLGQFVTVNNTQVHYSVAGQGPDLILIHGAGGNLRDFTFQLVQKLTPTNRVWCFDRPGHGYTDTLHKWGETLDEQAALLHAAAQKIGIPPAIVAGYSLGGSVALRWALDYPETAKSLLMMSPVTNRWHTPLNPTYHLAAHPVTSTPFIWGISTFSAQSLIDSTLHSVFHPNPVPEGYLDYVGVGLAMRPSCLRANARQVRYLKEQVTEMSPRYGALKMPITTIHGQADESVPARAHSDVFVAQVPHAHYDRVVGVGHSTQHHAHAQIIAAVERFSKG